MIHLHRWSKDSPLCDDWYDFAIELVGESKAEIIQLKHSGYGFHSPLRLMLTLWYDSIRNHSWKMIIDALRKMDKPQVIESVEKECRISVRM